MHVLVATDGKLDPAKTAPFVAALAGEGGTVSVVTVVEVPRRLIQELRAVFGEQPNVHVDRDGEYVEVSAPRNAPAGWPGDDAILARYLQDKLEERTGPMAAALGEMGIEAATSVAESETPARTILEIASAHGADCIVMGSHGQGLFEGLLGSTGARVIRNAGVPVLIVR